MEVERIFGNLLGIKSLNYSQFVHDILLLERASPSLLKDLNGFRIFLSIP